MNEYEYRIPLFGPNYSNSRIIRIIRDNTAVGLVYIIITSLRPLVLGVAADND